MADPARVGYSTSALGKGRDLEEVLAEIPKSSLVEIAIGPRPVKNPYSLVDHMRHSLNLKLRGHASMPVGREKVLRPEADLNSILIFCSANFMEGYSMHPPRKKEVTTWSDFIVWAATRWEMATKVGIPFALETMYPDHQNPGAGHYWLEDAREVNNFLEWALHLDWTQPLVADLAHLRIGVNFQKWTDDQVRQLLAGPMLLEAHFSSNDSKRDMHRKVRDSDDQIHDWMKVVANSGHGIPFIDEGRRD